MLNRLVCGVKGHEPGEARLFVLVLGETVSVPTQEMVLVCPRCGTRLPGEPDEEAKAALQTRLNKYHGVK
jgi:hypothetical protein